MQVQAGKVESEDPQREKKLSIQEERLTSRMVKPRHRNLFKKLLEKKTTKNKEQFILEKNRKRIDDEERQKKKAVKVATKSK